MEEVQGERTTRRRPFQGPARGETEEGSGEGRQRAGGGEDRPLRGCRCFTRRAPLQAQESSDRRRAPREVHAPSFRTHRQPPDPSLEAAETDERGRRSVAEFVERDQSTEARHRLCRELSKGQRAVNDHPDRPLSAGIALLRVTDSLDDTTTQTKARSRQRSGIEKAIEELRQLPCRFDFSFLTVVAASCGDDDAPATLVTSPPAPQTDALFHYGFALRCLASDYAWIYDRPGY